MFLLVLTLFSLEPGYHKLRTFAPIPEQGDEYLSGPTCFAFSPEGRLYLVDATTSRIHVWNKDTSYLTSFGSAGEGPGESQFPDRADYKDGVLYVLDQTGRMSRYDGEGTYLDSFTLLKPRLRNFSVINENLYLLSTREQVTGTEIYNRIELVDKEGNLVKLLQKFRNESFVTPRHGDNVAKVKAFPPSVDLQRGGINSWYFGFSQNARFFSIDGTGKLIAETKMQIPTDKCSAEEIKKHDELALSCTGGVMVLKNFPTIKIDYTHPKSYYTKFAVQGDRVVFSRTPDGGVFSCEGYPAGEYVICDLKTGKPLSSGRFDLGEGSLLFFRDEHILAIINSEERLEVAEIAFGKKK